MLENSNPEKKLTRAKLQEAYLCYLGGTKVEVLFGSFCFLWILLGFYWFACFLFFRCHFKDMIQKTNHVRLREKIFC